MTEVDDVLADCEAHRLASSAVGDDFKIFVGDCSLPEAPLEDRKVFYLTDANGSFGAAVDIARGLQLMGHLPPMLIVGIGYPLGRLSETIAIRTRDLTPTNDSNVAAFVSGAAQSGGAGAFMEFIGDELMPWVASRYDADHDDRALSGFSLGGLFATSVLLERPGLFSRYVIGSPSYWWDSYSLFDRLAEQRDTLVDVDARVFFGIGGLETHEGRMIEAERMPRAVRDALAEFNLDMVSDLDRFVTEVRDAAGDRLDIEHVVFADEFHVSASPALNSRALRWLYDAPAP